MNDRPSSPPISPLVSTAWLAERLGSPRLKVLDATWFLPGQGDFHAAFRAAHIPGAVHFDIDAVADHADPLPHMLPSPEAFAAAVGALGVADDDTVVTYGMAGPRVWWSLRVMGHGAVFVLDGGLAKWIAEGRPTEAGEPHPQAQTFTPRFRPELVADLEAVRLALADGRPVLDARPADRFRGETPEPRPGLRGGHMPGATNLPSSTLFAADGTFKPKADLAALLGRMDQEAAVATCGSGVAACAIALAQAELGRWDTAVYDGSWTEWGGRSDTAVASGG